MSELIIEIINDIRNKELTDFNKVQIETMFDIYLNLVDLSMIDLHLLYIFIDTLRLHEQSFVENKVLHLKYEELKMKVFRMSMNNLSCFLSKNNVVDNIQIYKPGKLLDLVSKKNVTMYEDGHIEETTLFDIHPECNIETDSPLFNDYAQNMINK